MKNNHAGRSCTHLRSPIFPHYSLFPAMALRLLPLPSELSGAFLVDSTGFGHAHKKLTGEATFLRRKRNTLTSVRSVPCCSAQPQSPPPACPGRAFPEPDQKRWDGPKPIAIVGSTGSIGTQTLDIVAENPDKFEVVALAAGSNVTLLADQIKTFKPKLVSIKNKALSDELKEAIADMDQKPEIIPGDGVIEVARHPDAVTVVTGIVR